MVSRRTVIKGLGAAGALGTAALGAPRVAFAAAPTDRRLVVVILRGGLDGLGAVAPYADPDYQRLRPNIGVPPPGGDKGALDLDGRFGLHPALAPLHPLFKSRELLVVHAVGSMARTRSHFDAQDVLENGTRRPRGAADGWLNRALAAMDGGRGRMGRMGLAVGHAVPLLMRGNVPVRTWAPTVLPAADGTFLDRLAVMYRHDALFADALKAGRKSAAGATRALGMEGRRMRGRRGLGGKAFKVMAGSAGKLLRAADGPRVASLEIGGWDTHVNQANRLNRVLGQLAEGLAALKDGLGPAWAKTAVVVVSEFGRTVAENGSRGTDHGTAGVALLLGGAVRGGRVAGVWPGLSGSARFDGRDLAPTTDLRALFKGVLRDHLGIATAALDATVFPDSAAAKPLRGLIRRG